MNKVQISYIIFLVTSLLFLQSCSNSDIVINKNAQQATDSDTNRRSPEQNFNQKKSIPVDTSLKRSAAEYDAYQNYQANNVPVSLKELKQAKRHPVLNSKELNHRMDKIKKNNNIKNKQKSPPVNGDSNLEEVIKYNKQKKKREALSKTKIEQDSILSPKVKVEPTPITTPKVKLKPAPEPIVISKEAKAEQPPTTAPKAETEPTSPSTIVEPKTAKAESSPITTPKVKLKPAPEPIVIPKEAKAEQSPTTAPKVKTEPIAPSTIAAPKVKLKPTPEPIVMPKEAKAEQSTTTAPKVKTEPIAPLTIAAPKVKLKPAPEPISAPKNTTKKQSSPSNAKISSKKDMQDLSQEELEKILKEKFSKGEKKGYIDSLDDEELYQNNSNISSPAVAKMIAYHKETRLSKINSFLIGVYFQVKHKIISLLHNNL